MDDVNSARSEARNCRRKRNVAVIKEIPYRNSTPVTHSEYLLRGGYHVVSPRVYMIARDLLSPVCARRNFRIKETELNDIRRYVISILDTPY